MSHSLIQPSCVADLDAFLSDVDSDDGYQSLVIECSAAAVRAAEAAELFDSLIGRGAATVSSCTATARATFDSIIASLFALRQEISAKATGLRHHRAKWLAKQSEAADHTEKLLSALARSVEVFNSDAFDVVEYTRAVQGLVDTSVLPSLSCTINCPPMLPSVLESLASSSRVQSDMHRYQCVMSGPGAEACRPCAEDNRVHITCVDGAGEPVNGLAASDFSITILPGDVIDVGMLGNTLSFCYGLEAGASVKHVLIFVSLWGAPLCDATVLVGSYTCTCALPLHRRRLYSPFHVSLRISRIPAHQFAQA